MANEPSTPVQEREQFVESEDEPEGGPVGKMGNKLAETSGGGAGKEGDDEPHVAKRTRRSSEGHMVDEGSTPVREQGETFVQSEDQPVEGPVDGMRDEVAGTSSGPLAPAEEGGDNPQVSIPEANVGTELQVGVTSQGQIASGNINQEGPANGALLPSLDLLDRAMGRPDEPLTQVGVDFPELNFLDSALVGDVNGSDMDM